jgi:hypothetical protein
MGIITKVSAFAKHNGKEILVTKEVHLDGKTLLINVMT